MLRVKTRRATKVGRTVGKRASTRWIGTRSSREIRFDSGPTFDDAVRKENAPATHAEFLNLGKR